jgi:DNA-binding MarR family transcriptional regulator
VQEVTEKLNIARGTIKRVYDELERAGFVEKVQGRGTFVRYQPANSGSRKEQAMVAIDAMLKQLENMGLSPAEINIFLNLKLRQWAEQEAHVKVALVECNPENLSQLSEQLRNINGVDLYAYLLESIQQYPYKLSEEFDLVVTTSAHGDYIESVLPVKKRLARVALRPSARYLSHLFKLRAGEKLGIVGYSKRFAQLMYTTCKTYVEEAEVFEPVVAASETELKAYLSDKSVVLVPKSYEKYFSAEVVKILKDFGGALVDCYYEMDEGSLLYLESKIKRLLEAKTI